MRGLLLVTTIFLGCCSYQNNVWNEEGISTNTSSAHCEESPILGEWFAIIPIINKESYLEFFSDCIATETYCEMEYEWKASMEPITTINVSKSNGKLGCPRLGENEIEKEYTGDKLIIHGAVTIEYERVPKSWFSSIYF